MTIFWYNDSETAHLWVFCVIIVILLVAGLLVSTSAIAELFSSIISPPINKYLCWRYPIIHHDRKTTIPTCPYRWPNGQGDVGKFLEGIENSPLWANKYGSVYRIWSGMTPEVVLTKREHVQTVFKDSDSHMKAINNNSGYLMSRVLGQCVGLISGDEWRRVRVVTEHPFSHRNMANYCSVVENRIQTHFCGLYKSGNLRDGLIDPAGDLKLLPFLVVAEVIYGELSPEMESQLRDLAPLRENLFRYVIQGGLSRFWWSQYLPIKANKLLNTFRNKWIAFNKMAYQRAVDMGTNAPIIEMFRIVESGTIDSEQLYQTLDEMLYANLDVTIGGISWNLVFLANSKPTQARIIDEIVETKANATDPVSSMRKYILSSSTFLAACAAESSRLKPLAAFSVPQSAPTERIIDGFRIPANTNFLVDAYTLNINNHFWGADSTVYRPERFLKRTRSTEARYNFWRFGFGPRQCMGKYLADLIIRALLTYLVENYDLDFLEKDRDGGWARDETTWITHPKILLKCMPRSEKLGSKTD